MSKLLLCSCYIDIMLFPSHLSNKSFISILRLLIFSLAIQTRYLVMIYEFEIAINKLNYVLLTQLIFLAIITN